VIASGERCGCPIQGFGETSTEATQFHLQSQGTSCSFWKRVFGGGSAWTRLLKLVDEAADDEREVFAPAQELGAEAWAEIVTLPDSISKLKKVKHLQLYGSALLRIPPAIAGMESLEKFTPYTSYGLHWFPYEITHCPRLTNSSVSTRAIYGNPKNKLAFPRLPVLADVLVPDSCSVCRGRFTGSQPLQRWVSQRVATDVLPLLVHACSQACLEAIPAPPEGYEPGPHEGRAAGG
jgi:hypothetical protein